MKKFLIENWSKLMINSSIMMVSFGFMIYAIGSVTANDSSINDLNNKLNYKVVPINKDGTISVKLTDEQLLKLAPSSVQAINIEEIAGRPVCYSYSKDCNELNVLNLIK
jgi:hypothetical protein